MRPSVSAPTENALHPHLDLWHPLREQGGVGLGSNPALHFAEWVGLCSCGQRYCSADRWIGAAGFRSFCPRLQPELQLPGSSDQSTTETHGLLLPPLRPAQVYTGGLVSIISTMTSEQYAKLQVRAATLKLRHTQRGHFCSPTRWQQPLSPESTPAPCPHQPSLLTFSCPTSYTRRAAGERLLGHCVCLGVWRGRLLHHLQQRLLLQRVQQGVLPAGGAE